MKNLKIRQSLFIQLFLILISFLVFDQFALANEISSELTQTNNIIYKNIDQNDLEYQAEKVAKTDSVGYDEYLADSQAPANLKDNLTRAFLTAQEHFLKSEISVIENYWQDVTVFALKADWDKAQREMIQIAYMRLAQSASNAEDTRKYLSYAIEFDNTYKPNQKLFPPPLIDQYLALRAQSNNVPVLFKNADGFTYILLNGNKYKISNRTPLEITSGIKRITYISPTFAPVTRILDAQEIANYIPQKKILAKINGLKIPLVQTSQIHIPSIENKISTPTQSRFYQKPKFWIGATLLAGAALIIHNSSQNKNDSPSPTHREGF